MGYTLFGEHNLLIFGGDRHKMSFNDVYLLEMDKIMNMSSVKY
jgi:hypothetical protein